MKVDCGVQSCILPLRAYRRVFPNNLTIDDLPKSSALQSADHTTCNFYKDGILSFYGAVILKVAQCKTGKLMQIRFFIVCTAVCPLQDHNTTFHPLQDHSATVPPLQDHTIIHSRDDHVSRLL